MTLEPTPSVSQFVDVDNLRLHYLDFGDTSLPPGEDPRVKMLCLHGGAAQAHWFDFVAGPFLEDYRVLSLDLRGHGDRDWGPPDKYNYSGQADIHSKLVAIQEVINAAGLCMFGSLCYPIQTLPEQLSAATGQDYDMEKIYEVGMDPRLCLGVIGANNGKLELV